MVDVLWIYFFTFLLFLLVDVILIFCLLPVVVPFSYEDTSIDQCVCDSKHACVQEVETLNTCC